jgi:hypothetical protein
MKYILLIFISIFAIGCSSVFETNNDQFIEEIIRNPALVKNLKNAFPDRINDTLIHKAMLDVNYLMKLEKDLIIYNSIYCSGDVIRFDSVQSSSTLEYLNKRKNCQNEILGKDLILYSIYKKIDKILRVFIITKNNHKYIYLIKVTGEYEM